MAVQPVPSNDVPASVSTGVPLRGLTAVRFRQSVRDPHGSEQFFVSATELVAIGFWESAQCVVVKWYDRVQVIPMSNVVYVNLIG